MVVAGAVCATADLSFYLNAWGAMDAGVADATTTDAGVGDPGYGEPDGAVTAGDTRFVVNAWILGCSWSGSGRRAPRAQSGFAVPFSNKTHSCIIGRSAGLGAGGAPAVWCNAPRTAEGERRCTPD